MCGRFALHHPNDEIHEQFQVEHPEFLFEPRYNIAPTQAIAVVTADRSLVGMKWGLVPRWSKDGKPFINARGETITEKPSFRENFNSRRIIVPCSGFYEWKAEGKLRLPFYIRMRDQRPFGIGAVYEPGAVPTVALVTTAANAVLSPFHDRMPVILAPGDYARWLGEPGAASLIRPFPPEAMEAFPVSTRVNGVKDDDAGLIEPERRGLFG
ncbi:MAG: SOS response-associated peptidase [Deltaproteobacteria bacterium]|nr:SOS response-associated peptidase [Deltaproteobacteria bacterium]